MSEVGWLQGVNEVANGDVGSALAQHDLDYEVGLFPMHVRHRHHGKEMRKGVPEHKAVVRLDTFETIWVVGDRYNLVQHAEAFGVLDELVSEGRTQIHSVQNVRDGRKVMIVSEMEPFLVAGEEFKRYQAWFNSHDGKTPVVMVSIPTRSFCTNAIPGMISMAGKVPGSYRIKHTRRAHIRLAEAQEEIFGVRGEEAELEELNEEYAKVLEREGKGLRYAAAEALDVEAKYVAQVQALGDELAGRRMGTQGFEGFLKQLVPITPDMSAHGVTSRDNKRADIRSIWVSADDLGNIRDTAWGALQAVVMYNDHFKNYKSIDSKLESIVRGGPDVAKALELLRN